jgi:hypothetical protein
MVTFWTTLQSVSVTGVDGEAVSEPGGVVPQTPAPAPEAPTVTLMLDEPSETVTVPPAKAAEGLVRRIERMLVPLTEAVTLLLPDTAV